MNKLGNWLKQIWRTLTDDTSAWDQYREARAKVLVDDCFPDLGR